MRRRAILSLLLVAATSSPAGAQNAGTDVEYGRVDAATVRVFAIGTVSLVKLTVGGERIKIARPSAGFGSGFATGGLIVTAHHVIEDARHIVVRLPGEGGFYPARLVYGDAPHDVAILLIEANPAALDIATGEALRVRQTVFAIGYPLDPRRTQAQSARGIVAGQKDDDTIQLDMALNPGNSGGPLVDEQDRVVGMVVARGNPDQGVQGIGFAVRADRLAIDLKEGQRRVEAGEVPALAAQQPLSAVVVDEFVQQGVFHEIKEAADLENGLSTETVQKKLDELASRIEDPDLLVFVAAHLWNVSLALRLADESSLQEAHLTRVEANKLSRRFGKVAATACRKARKLDADVGKRSPIVPVILEAYPEGPGIERESEHDERPALRWTPPSLSLILRASAQLRVNPWSGSVGLGTGLGLAVGMKEWRFRLGAALVTPIAGVSYGSVELLDDSLGTVRHAYLGLEVGAVADVWSRGKRRVEVAAVWSPSRYTVDIDGTDMSRSSHEQEMTVGHGRLAGGYRWRGAYVGAALHVFDGPTMWFEPVVLALAF